MRIIKESFLTEAATRHSDAAKHLESWRKVARAASWKSLVDIRKTYPDTDMVRVHSGRKVLVFNIRKNNFRLIAAVHFNRQVIYTLRFMTHAEYSKDRWKDAL